MTKESLKSPVIEIVSIQKSRLPDEKVRGKVSERYTETTVHEGMHHAMQFDSETLFHATHIVEEGIRYWEVAEKAASRIDRPGSVFSEKLFCVPIDENMGYKELAQGVEYYINNSSNAALMQAEGVIVKVT